MKAYKKSIFVVWISLVIGIVSGCQSGQYLPATLEMSDTQVLLAGAENPIRIVRYGLSEDEITLHCDKERATIIKTAPFTYSIFPLGNWKGGLSVQFYHKTKAGDSTLLEARNYRLLQLNSAYVHFQGYIDEDILKEAVLAAKTLQANIATGSLREISGKVSYYEYLIFSKTDDFIKKGTVHGNHIPKGLKKAFANLNTGDQLFFYNIRVTTTNLKRSPLTCNDIKLCIR